MRRVISTTSLIIMSVLASTAFIALSIVYGQTTLSTDVTVGDGAHVGGTLSKGSGSFVIDHPLDPKNKLLYHSFVESPDVKNIYDGVVTLNGSGEATIVLPDYFLVLNDDIRYLATPLHQAMPNLYLKEEVTERKRFLRTQNVFTIAGGVPHGEVSWQVTGIRKDPFILQNPIITEVEKSEDRVADVGECLYEPLCF